MNTFASSEGVPESSKFEIIPNILEKYFSRISAETVTYHTYAFFPRNFALTYNFLLNHIFSSSIDHNIWVNLFGRFFGVLFGFLESLEFRYSRLFELEISNVAFQRVLSELFVSFRFLFFVDLFNFLRKLSGDYEMTSPSFLDYWKFSCCFEKPYSTCS